MSSAPGWRDYQRRTAHFYRRLGLSATVEHKVEGARGVHALDVYVEGEYHGIAFKWVVECKAWASAVPKEKVMALAAIVHDVGADRGFLLSEKGFQSGAIRAAAKTNITLSSLADLSDETEAHFVDAAIGALNWRVAKALTRLRDMDNRNRRGYFDPDPTFRPVIELMALNLMLERAARGEYPIIGVHYFARKKFETLDELLPFAEAVITAAARWTPPGRRTRV